MLKVVKNLLVIAIFALFSGLIITYQPGWFFGLIFLLFFLFYYSNLAYLLLVRLFNFPKNSFLRRFFGILIVFWLFVTSVGFLILSGFSTFYLGVLVLPFTIVLLNMFLGLSVLKQKKEESLLEAEEVREIVLPSSTSFLAAVLILMAGAFYILFQHETGAEIWTPWAILPDYYPYLYLLIYLVLGLLIFTNNHAKTLLALFFVFSLLCHFNLAFTHELIYGADYWRHLGTQNQILQNGGVTIRNFMENPGWIEKMNFGLYSYSGFWGLNVILNLFTGIDLLNLGKFVGPIIWSLFVPVLFYALGRILNLSKRLALFLVWLSFVPSALLISGSFSLPSSLHFIFWLFSLILLLKADFSENKNQLWALLIVGLLLSSGYLLYAVIFFLALGLKLLNIYLIKNNLLNNVAWFFISIFAVLFLPVLEIVSGYSQMSFKSDLFSAIKQFVGNLTGVYFAFGPRPHTISTGNILFYQTPQSSFVENIFTIWPYWLILTAVLFCTLAIYGMIKFFLRNENQKWLGVFFFSLFGGYFISRYLLNGENILTRRLDVVLATGLIVFFCLAILYFQKYLLKRKFILIGIICLSFFGATIYTLGPVSRAVSSQEYLDYQDIYHQVKEEKNFCIIADPYNLTVLEGISAKKIVGGGFPIKGDFSQTELQAVLKDWEDGKDKDQIIKQAKNITGANTCFVLEKNVGDSGIESKVKMLKY